MGLLRDAEATLESVAWHGVTVVVRAADAAPTGACRSALADAVAGDPKDGAGGGAGGERGFGNCAESEEVARGGEKPPPTTLDDPPSRPHSREASARPSLLPPSLASF